MTRSTIEVRGLSVEVARKRIRYIRLRVARDGSVCLSVPWHVAAKEAVDFLVSKWDWVEEARAKARERPSPEPLRYRNGDTVLLFGAPCRLEIVDVPYGGNIVELRDGAVRIYQAGETSPERRARLVESFRAARLRERLGALLDAWLVRLGEGPVKWTLRNMSTEWGSCTKTRRTLRFGLQLAQVPPACIEYVVVHELTHLRVANHGPDFKALMDARMPDWRERRKALNAFRLP
jgi:predicted metal-dependent hydrolase